MPQITETPSPTQMPERAPRQRLSATVRITQILDAALQVFSDKGFASARIDDIAAAAQLSKGGIYTHFRSKEEIFEALLTRMLEHAQQQVPPLPAEAHVTVDVLVQQIIVPMYAALAEVSTLRTLRLLLADGARAPQIMGRWREAVLEPHHREVERLVRLGVAQGALREGVLTQAPRLIVTPGLQAMLDLMVELPGAQAQLLRQQQLHIALLRESLEP